MYIKLILEKRVGLLCVANLFKAFIAIPYNFMNIQAVLFVGVNMHHVNFSHTS